MGENRIKRKKKLYYCYLINDHCELITISFILIYNYSIYNYRFFGLLLGFILIINFHLDDLLVEV